MWYVTAAIALIILAVAFVPVRVIFSYSTAGITRLSLKIGFIKIKLLPSKEKKPKTKKSAKKTKPAKPKKKQSVIKKLQSALDLYDNFSEDFVSLLDYISRKAVNFEQLMLHINYSTGNAATTGILCGAINGIVYGLLGVIHNRTRLENPDIIIQPEFDDAHFIVKSRCILRLKNVHIIVIAVKLLLLILKIKRHLRSKNASEK